MSGSRKIIVGNITTSKVRGNALKNALGELMDQKKVNQLPKKQSIKKK